MSLRSVYNFPSFNGEHPFMGIILIPWNYNTCILVAASWCLTHTTPITKKYFLEMSIENPYRVVAGFINTRFHQSIKSQISLGIEAVFHPNPLVTFVLIKVIPEFQRTLFVDYQQLKYNENEPVNDDCDSMYWSLFGNEMSGENFDYVYMLINQNPCPYGRCHYSNKTECSVFDSFEKNAISATILCNDHLMSFAEFGYGKDNGSVHYHKITNEIIIWLKQHIHSL